MSSQPPAAADQLPLGEQKYVNNAGVTIHYRKYAHRDPSAPYILFQHGFPDQETTWNDYQIPVFSRHYNIITPTLRGFPPSDIPPDTSDYTGTAYATDMLAILNQENVTSVYLIGHDFGGGLVQGFSQAFPDRVKALIIINAPIMPTFLPLLSYDAEAQEYARYTIPYYSYVPGQPKNIPTIVKTIRDPVYRRKIADYLDRSPIHGMLNFYKNNYPGPTYGQDLTTALNMTKETWTQRVPTMVLWGEEDDYFSPKTIDGLLGWFQLGVRLVTVPKSGHWPFRDQWKRSNQEILSFLAIADDVEKDGL